MTARIKAQIAMIVTVIILSIAGYWLTEAAQPVKAKSSADVCQMVAKVNAIEYYYCEPNDAPPFLANSMGFMTPAQ